MAKASGGCQRSLSSTDPYEPNHSDEQIRGEDVDSVLAAEDFVNLFDVLRHLGVDAVDACKFVCSLKQKPPTTFMEWYGRGSVARAATVCYKIPAVHGVDALDLRTLKPSDQSWDFTKMSDRRLALWLVQLRKPTWVIASPARTAFSSLMKLNCKTVTL